MRCNGCEVSNRPNAQHTELVVVTSEADWYRLIGLEPISTSFEIQTPTLGVMGSIGVSHTNTRLSLTTDS